MSERIKVGVIGFGLSAKTFHIPLLLSLPNQFELTHIVSRSHDGATVNIDGKNVQVLKSTEELFKTETVQLVIITTPTDTHAQLCRDAIKAKKHVVVEKPFTASYKEAEAIHKEANESGIIISVYHNRRWDGDFLTLKKLIKNETLGRIVSVTSRFDRYRPVGKGGWRESDVNGGGVLLDLGSHLVDQAVDLFGVPATIHAIVQHQRQHATDDSFHIALTYTNSDLVVHLAAGIHVRTETPRFVVHGTKGAWTKPGLDVQEAQLKAGLSPIKNADVFGVEANRENWGSLDTDIGSDHAKLHFVGKIETEKGSYLEYYKNVAEAISKKNKDLVKVTTSQALVVMKLLELAQQSSESQTLVKVQL